MLINKFFISSFYLLLITGGLLITQIQLFFIGLLLVTFIAAVIIKRKVSAPIDSYYIHIQKTSFLSLLMAASSLPILAGAVFIDYQLNLLYPSVEMIAMNPAEAATLSASLFSLFGWIFLACLLFISYRSYKLFIALSKDEPI